MMEGEGHVVSSEVTPSVMRTGGEGRGTMMLEERRPSQNLMKHDTLCFGGIVMNSEPLICGCGGMADTADLL